MTPKTDTHAVDLREAKEMVRRIIEHHFGGKPKHIAPRSGGASNLVFAVSHSVDELIVRMSPDRKKFNVYLKEQWATARARAAGVPAPEVLAVGNEVVSMAYMVLRKSAGSEATYHRRRMQILREAGQYAALINTIPTEGFGGQYEWSPDRFSPHATWADFLRDELRAEGRVQTLESYRMLTGSQSAKVRAILEGAGNNREPALTHGDLRLKNILVDEEGRITSILDWENCTSNLAPEWEMSLALHDLSIDEKQELIAGYGLRAEMVMELAPVIKALNIINYAPPVERAAESKEAAMLEQYQVRLSGALDLYSL